MSAILILARVSGFKELFKRTGINWEKQARPLLGELSVQILPTNAGLHNHIHVGLIDLDDVVHIGEVDADASIRCREVTFKASASRVWDDRNAMTVADSDYSGNLLSVARISHCNRKLVWIYCRPAGVAVSLQVVGVCGYDVFFIPKLPYYIRDGL
jgi:hypothetical protein